VELPKDWKLFPYPLFIQELYNMAYVASLEFSSVWLSG